MRYILIIGATSAIAAELAHLYHKDSEALFIVGRSEAKCNALKHSLGSQCLGSCAVDFTNAEKLDDAWVQITDCLPRIDIALIAHGYLGDQLLSEHQFAEAQKIIQVNLISAVHWLIKISEFMDHQGSGKIAVLTSVAGERGRPRNFTYGASKGALNLYLEGLRSQLWGKVEIYTIKLGPVDTPMTKTHPKNFSFTTKCHAAERIYSTLNTTRYVKFIPGFWKYVMYVVRWMPEWLFQRLSFLSGR